MESNGEYPNVSGESNEARRCTGWIIADHVIVQCPEIIPDRPAELITSIRGPLPKYCSQKCATRTWHFRQRGFSLGDRYVFLKSCADCRTQIEGRKTLCAHCKQKRKSARHARWVQENRPYVRQAAKDWAAANPEKVKAHKRRAAQKYAPRRRMLFETRTPERIESDNRKQREYMHGWYQNRSPEQVQKDQERSRAIYQAKQTKLAEAQRKAAEALVETERLRAAKGGQPQHEDTQARITLAACLSIERLSKGKMKYELYPTHVPKPESNGGQIQAQNLAKAALSNTKVLFSRNKKAIELEKKRLSALPDSERQAEAECARIKLAPKANCSFPQSRGLQNLP